MRASITGTAWALAAVLCLAGLLFLYARDSRQTRGQPGHDEITPSVDEGYELLTILGDVSGVAIHREGRWAVARDGKLGALPSQDEMEKLSELMALPYTGGVTPAPLLTNVTRHDREGSYGGVNVYSSGHKPAAFLIDMQGNVLHEWSYAVEDVWPDTPRTVHSTFWRRVHAYANGGLLAVFEGIGLLKLDRDSNLLWSHKGGNHHQVFVSDTGDIYTLTREGGIDRRVNPKEPVLHDFITVLTSSGELKKKVSVLDAFRDTEFEPTLRGMATTRDLLHTNSIVALDGTLVQLSDHYAKGNVLISLRKPNTIAIVDMKREKVVWAHQATRGEWGRQHDPVLLANGNMLVFDNSGLETLGRRGESRVIEFDPVTVKFVWQFPGESGLELYSRTCGAAARLPNGNTLITESDQGRAIEVTADKRIVWEFYNPHRSGLNRQNIATLFEMTRLPSDYFSEAGIPAR